MNNDEKYNALENPNTQAETLTQLAGETNTDIRAEVANHPNTKIETLAQLATDENEEIRRNVALNENCTEKLLTQLANDAEASVRIGVAMNTQTPIHLLKKLEKDENKGLTHLLNRRRIGQINTYINTLTEEKQTHARLLAPTFTGWSDDLKNVLVNLETKQHNVGRKQ